MTEKRKQHLEISIPSGSPEELCVFRRKGWTGKGTFFARSYFTKQSIELTNADMGVYILWQEPDESEPQPRMYVGEGWVLSRLDGHERKKDFWGRGAVFTGTDLDKSLVKHLEGQLVRLAKDVGRSEVKNKQNPKMSPLSHSDEQFAQEYLNFMRLCMRIMGVRFLEKPERISTAPRLYLKSKHIEAEGYESKEGFVVLAGAGMVKTPTPSIHTFLSVHRNELIEKEIAEPNEGMYRITKDYVFKSPSDAAGVLLGGATSGLKSWKDENGQTLNDIRKSLST